MEIQKSLGFMLNVSARLMARKLDAELKPSGLTTAQWACLKLLSVEDNLSQAEIADKTNTDRATCGSVIERLISKGLVTKELSETDRRSYIVKILPSALSLTAEASTLAENINSLALQGLSESDIAVLVKSLETIIKNTGGNI